MNRLLGLILTFAITYISGYAEQPVDTIRPVHSTLTLKIGAANLSETYLSPLKYSGMAFGIGYESMQAMKFNPEHWVRSLRVDIDAAHTENPARNGTIWQVMLHGGWGMMHRWKFAEGWIIYGGGTTDLDLGALYRLHNTNNPVAAKASWTIGAIGAVAWNGKLRNTPICIRYQLTMPLTGIFFSPEYGESYYEIYLGNHSGLVHAAWPCNFFRLDNQLTADFRFGETSLRIGYRLDYHSSRASDIVTRRTNHYAIIGIASEWISLSPKRCNFENARIISALY